jgi:hypothetical protein
MVHVSLFSTFAYHELVIGRDGFRIMVLRDVGAPVGMFPPTRRDYEEPACRTRF